MSHGHAPSAMVLRRSRSSLVGRERELTAAAAALEAGHRIVTFVGAPGIGKTRVMERLAQELGARRRALWVDLGEARTVDAMVVLVARALDISLAATSTADACAAVARALARAPIALCLDNLEQLLDAPAAATSGAAVDVLSAWLHAAPITLLSTSRTPLGMAGEHTLEIGPLSHAAGIALFEERAVAVGSRHREADASARALALSEMDRICKRLGGNPLAIEIAAARVGALGVSALLTHLSSHAAPALGDHDVDAHAQRARHAAVADAFSWSWALLSEAERRALSHLAAFRGGFSLDGAERVIAVQQHAPSDLLVALCDLSLVDVSHGVGGARFRVSPLVRDLIEARADPDEAAGARARHALAFAQRDTVDASEVHNLDAAIDACREPVLRARLVRLLAPHFARFGTRDAHERALARGIEGACASSMPILEHDLHRARAALASDAGDVRRALACDERALALAGQDVALRVACMVRVGTHRRELGRTADGLTQLRAAVALAEDAGLRAREALARAALGRALLSDGAAPPALEELTRASALSADSDDIALRRRTLLELVTCQRRLGLIEAAARRLVEIEALLDGCDDEDALFARLERGALLRAQHRLADADAALAVVVARADAGGWPRLVAEALTLRAQVALDRGDLERGRTLAEDALAVAARLEPASYRADASTVLASALALAGDAAGASAILDGAAAPHTQADSVDAITRVRASCERALLHAASADAGDAALASLLADLLAAARPLGGSPQACALAVAVATSDDVNEDASALADRLLSRTADEEARAVLLSARGARASAFALARRIEQSRAGRTAREILVAADGRYFEVDGKRTSLQRQRCLRQIFLALVEHAERAPGLGLSQTEVLARGWPGERMRADSGAMRVYTSIRRLRKSGLSGVLLTRDDGYLIDPTVAIRRVAQRAAQ